MEAENKRERVMRDRERESKDTLCRVDDNMKSMKERNRRQKKYKGKVKMCRER